LLTLRAVERVLDKGDLDVRLLAVGAASFSLLLSLVTWGSDGLVWIPHMLQIAAMAGVAVVLLWLCARFGSREGFTLLLIAVIAVEALLIARPSFYWERLIASQAVQPFNDQTLPALAAIQQRDRSAFRIEKSYTSIHLSEAMAQNYGGVKSYYHHGKAVVDFHVAMDLMVQYPFSRPLNWTNWLPDPGERYALHSLLGVKYVIANGPLPEWPGFQRLLAGPGYAVYQNEFVLPLAVVQSAQVTREQLAALSSFPELRSRWIKDAALINAVVLDQLRPDWGHPFDLDALTKQWPLDTAATYTKPALALQRSGLQLTHFSSSRLAGRIHPADRGILVFSIPFYEGWRLRIDGQPTPLFKANFGMLAAPISAGFHEVELTYERPGRWTGFVLGLIGIALLALARWRAAGGGHLNNA
jgi:uncharacterized membrane protein YfhO